MLSFLTNLWGLSDVFESDKYDLKFIFTCSFWTFFHGSGSELADPDSGKKVLTESGQKEPDPKLWL